MNPLPVGPQDALADLAPCFDSLIRYHVANTPMSPPWRLLKAQMRQESQFNPIAVSRTGPIGLFQFTAATWKQYAKPGADRRDVFDATGAAVRYMADLRSWALRHRVMGQNVYRFALGAYNAGMGSLLEAMKRASAAGADPTDWENLIRSLIPVVGPMKLQEVSDYVDRIMTWWAEYESAALSEEAARTD